MRDSETTILAPVPPKTKRGKMSAKGNIIDHPIEYLVDNIYDRKFTTVKIQRQL